jgi:hypothetical protein
MPVLQNKPNLNRLYIILGMEDWAAMERVKGIEPSYSAWKAAALPLSYTRGAPTLAISARRSTEKSWYAGLHSFSFGS